MKDKSKGDTSDPWVKLVDVTMSKDGSVLQKWRVYCNGQTADIISKTNLKGDTQISGDDIETQFDKHAMGAQEVVGHILKDAHPRYYPNPGRKVKLDAGFPGAQKSLAARVATRYLRRLADARSLANSIRDRLWTEILQLLGPETWDLSVGQGSGMYDTNQQGKGFREGYVSFAAKPTIWSNAGLVGGLLFRFKYSPEGIIPSKGTPEFEKWQKGGELDLAKAVVEIGELSGGYYNKQAGGSVEMFSESLLAEGDVPEEALEEIGVKGTGVSRSDLYFGRVLFEVDAKEQVTNWDWTDAASTRRRIQSVIDDTLARPPEGAISKNKVKERKRNPYTSVMKLIRHLIRSRRQEFYKDEAKLVAQAEGSTLLTVIDKMERKGFKYISTNAPFPVA